jgi:D-beta-D-heptose 7-phosphate kinase/D-beta-D-heptose 1-phosphate adenosyltransferase
MSSEIPTFAQAVEIVRTVIPSQRLLVVGDLMLDQYVWGDIKRISPEAPVPVVLRAREEARAGGAANVALNLAGLGTHVAVAGFVGADTAGRSLLEILASAGIPTHCCVTVPGRPTTTKLRVLAGHQHVLRMDAEHTAAMEDPHASQLVVRVRNHLRRGVDGIILSDYAKGALSTAACQAIIGVAKRKNVPVFVDPKGRDYARYAGATALTPNLSELALATGVAVDDVDALIRAGRELVGRLGLEYLVLTRGADGMTLIGPDQTLHQEAVAREVFDVSGAGDTVIATLATGHIAKLNALEMLRLANAAAGIVVTRVGTAPIDRASLLEALQSSNAVLKDAYTLDELDRIAAEWRRRGQKIVVAHGGFDLFHVGHASYLHRAAAHGDRLIVAVHTDALVRARKGAPRPIAAQTDRARVLTALECVDAVVFTAENPPMDVLHRLRPDVLATTAEHAPPKSICADLEARGSRVASIPRFERHATSAMIERIASGSSASEESLKSPRAVSHVRE